MVTSKSLVAASLGFLLVSSAGFSTAMPPPSTGGDRVIQDCLKLLRTNGQQKFCKAYINVNVPPVVTKTVTVTSTCNQNVRAGCTPTTTVTTVVGVTQTVTGATVTAEALTVTTGVVETELTTTTTTPSVTITTTLGTPFTGSKHRRKAPAERDVKLPKYLDKYNHEQIKAACYILLEIDLVGTRTCTTTTTKTVPPRATKTVTSTVATRTLTATITPDPFVVTSTTSTTTIIKTETAPTPMVTVCPYTRTDVTSFAGDQQQLSISESSTAEVACCIECWNNPVCTGWGWFPDHGFCAIIMGTAPLQPPTETCPSGPALVGFRTGGGVENKVVAGGGPCFGGWRDVTV